MIQFRVFVLCAVYLSTGITCKISFKPDIPFDVGPFDEASVWDRRCSSDVDCASEYRQICNLTSHSCACSRFAFKPIKSNTCLNQVIVDVETNDERALILRDFASFRTLVAERLNVSPHFVPSSSQRNAVRIFVDAKVFELEWNQSALEDLMNGVGVEGAMRAKVLSDVCEHPESNPCNENSICVVNKLRYEVQCVCKPGFRSSSEGIGTVCERKFVPCDGCDCPRRQRLCINGGVDSPAISACECHALFWGEHCEINLFRVCLIFILLLVMLYKIWKNLRDCFRNFDRRDARPTKVAAISYEYVENGGIKRRTVYSEEAKARMAVV